MEDLDKLFKFIWNLITRRISVLVLGAVLGAFGLTSDSCSFIDPSWQPEITTVVEEQKETEDDN